MKMPETPSNEELPPLIFPGPVPKPELSDDEAMAQFDRNQRNRKRTREIGASQPPTVRAILRRRFPENRIDS